MKRIAALLASAVLLAACGSDYGDNGGGGGSAGGSIATADAGGQTVLVNSDGKTLYALSAEKGGKFICTDSKCLAAWKPVEGKPEGDVGALSTVERPDGAKQVAYKGQPLYTFSGDKGKGDTNGEGVKDVGVWHAVTVSGAPAPSDSGGGGGGYGGY